MTHHHHHSGSSSASHHHHHHHHHSGSSSYSHRHHHHRDDNSSNASLWMAIALNSSRRNNEDRDSKRLEEGLLQSKEVKSEDKNDGKVPVEVSLKFMKVSFATSTLIWADCFIHYQSISNVAFLGDKASLYSTIIATSFACLTGFAILLGVSGALDTLCGQAYGAQEYKKIGTCTYSAIISLVLLCLPLSLIWINTGKLLTFIGQDPQISLEAGRYVMWLLPALFAYAILQALARNLQSQTLILALLLSSFSSVCMHKLLCQALVLKLGLKTVGAALAIDISYWLNVIFLVLYMKYSAACEKTRMSLTKEAIRGISEFLILGAHSTLIVCLGWGSLGLLILLPSRLPNPDVEMLVSCVNYNLLAVGFFLLCPFSLGAGASTCTSHELGAQSTQATRSAVLVWGFMAASAGVSFGVMIIVKPASFLPLFPEQNVADSPPGTITLAGISVALAYLQGALSGVMRGIGCQHLGAYVSLGAFCLLGMPIATLLSSQLHFGLTGIWIGINIGSTVQVVLLSLMIIYTNWEEQAVKAKERIAPSTDSVEILQ